MLISFTASTMMAGLQKGHPGRNISVPLIPEHVEEGDPRGNLLTQVRLEKRSLNGSSSGNGNGKSRFV